ncbi:MAG: hypothetical protein R3C52_09345 [Hyphomonadaceae bacterium]
MTGHLGIALGLAVLALGLGACGPGETTDEDLTRQARREMPKQAEAGGLMIQHCLRSPSCSLTRASADGAGEASGVAGWTRWFAQAADIVQEGGADYGARLLVSAVGPGGGGGEAGRPLTLDESPSDPMSARLIRSWLTVEFRTPPPDGAPEPYFLTIMPSAVLLASRPGEGARTRAELEEKTAAAVDAWTWPDGQHGAKVELFARKGLVWSGYTVGMPAHARITDRAALRLGSEPWLFYASQNIRDEPARDLLAALEADESLSIRVSAPSGALQSDALYGKGFSEAVRAGMEALADPDTARPLAERCGAGRDDFYFANDGDLFAVRSCDPRTGEQVAQLAYQAQQGLIRPREPEPEPQPEPGPAPPAD